MEDKDLTIGELKEIIKDVPDDYECTCLVEGMGLKHATVKHEEKIVDFCW